MVKRFNKFTGVTYIKGKYIIIYLWLKLIKHYILLSILFSSSFYLYAKQQSRVFPVVSLLFGKEKRRAIINGFTNSNKKNSKIVLEDKDRISLLEKINFPLFWSEFDDWKWKKKHINELKKHTPFDWIVMLKIEKTKQNYEIVSHWYDLNGKLKKKTFHPFYEIDIDYLKLFNYFAYTLLPNSIRYGLEVSELINSPEDNFSITSRKTINSPYLLLSFFNLNSVNNNVGIDGLDISTDISPYFGFLFWEYSYVVKNKENNNINLFQYSIFVYHLIYTLQLNFRSNFGTISVSLGSGPVLSTISSSDHRYYNFDIVFKYGIEYNFFISKSYYLYVNLYKIDLDFPELESIKFNNKINFFSIGIGKNFSKKILF